MKYETFKKIMDIAGQMIAVGASKDEVKDFFINRGINVTDSHVNELFEQ